MYFQATVSGVKLKENFIVTDILPSVYVNHFIWYSNIWHQASLWYQESNGYN